MSVGSAIGGAGAALGAVADLARTLQRLPEIRRNAYARRLARRYLAQRRQVRRWRQERERLTRRVAEARAAHDFRYARRLRQARGRADTRMRDAASRAGDEWIALIEWGASGETLRYLQGVGRDSFARIPADRGETASKASR